MHGVINTDNVSILGLTIDYGPYAFMDIYNPRHVCNHSDDMARYTYDRQPEMIQYSLQKLADTLSELIGYELSPSHQRDDLFQDIVLERPKLMEMKKIGQLAAAEVLSAFRQIYADQYLSLMRKVCAQSLFLPR